MPEVKHKVNLSDAEVTKLKEITQKGKSSARKIMHANILLKTNINNENVRSVREIAEILEISPNTVNAVKRTYTELGMDAALERKTQLTPSVASKITGDFEAQVIATALSPAPAGRSNWTLRLLAEHCMEKKYILEISHTAIGEMLNTNEVKPHLSKYWCVPKENDAHFVAHMEDVLGIYQRPYNPNIPVICMDEKPLQLLDEVYERVSAKPFRTDPDIDKIILISDNLNTHNISSFYEAYPPETAYRLLQKFEFHHTPIHGSWLNIAECELSSLAVQALGNRRINSVGLLNEVISDWQTDRNTRQKGVNWQFTNDKARVKLHRLYPKPIF